MVRQPAYFHSGKDYACPNSSHRMAISQSDERTPLLNRAPFREQLAPGSVFKIVMAPSWLLESLGKARQSESSSTAYCPAPGHADSNGENLRTVGAQRGMASSIFSKAIGGFLRRFPSTTSGSGLELMRLHEYARPRLRLRAGARGIDLAERGSGVIPSEEWGSQRVYSP